MKRAFERTCTDLTSLMIKRRAVQHNLELNRALKGTRLRLKEVQAREQELLVLDLKAEELLALMRKFQSANPANRISSREGIGKALHAASLDTEMVHADATGNLSFPETQTEKSTFMKDMAELSGWMTDPQRFVDREGYFNEGEWHTNYERCTDPNERRKKWATKFCCGFPLSALGFLIPPSPSTPPSVHRDDGKDRPPIPEEQKEDADKKCSDVDIASSSDSEDSEHADEMDGGDAVQRNGMNADEVNGGEAEKVNGEGADEVNGGAADEVNGGDAGEMNGEDAGEMNGEDSDEMNGEDSDDARGGVAAVDPVIDAVGGVNFGFRMRACGINAGRFSGGVTTELKAAPRLGRPGRGNLLRCRVKRLASCKSGLFGLMTMFKCRGGASGRV